MLLNNGDFFLNGLVTEMSEINKEMSISPHWHELL
jgi:hypothetical protein